ncbi:terpenoid cyclases/protein prenyltransferase alpha-alpha toroid [Apodospora peruviana]|uniref:Protein farnesyltransferase subunit beta n=1 Tax=Apodospora peruviana TaxID=516989 RepID=A0AAE0M380_9PEZI|nr:terpenoid cyclases/protein prenyltransferase alpha-alpha toroid [Apodospora peruviana]
MAAASSSATPASPSFNSNRSNESGDSNNDDDGFVDEEIITHGADTGFPSFMIPDVFTQGPPVRDALVTDTSRLQDKTVDTCLPYLSADHGDPSAYNMHGVRSLDREKHVRFLHGSLGRLSGRFVAADASRPWYLYWSLAGLAMLGEDVSGYREAVVKTARGMQNDEGGFGGGGRQLSHLATTYAVVLALALVGGEDAYEVVDRKAMWKWLCSLKQADGGFQVCVGGEEDIRGAYCASVVITLLNLPLDLTPESPAHSGGLSDLFAGLADWVRRCQTFEGGISGQPMAEAHGAYAFCALGCLALLDDPRRIIPRSLDVPRLISWLSARQYAPEGGFSGRTNKLVDGCYSHWVGGCFPLIEACLSTPAADARTSSNDDRKPAVADAAAAAGTKPQLLSPAPETLFSREGLIRYILCCCQDDTKRGGLRDKPGKFSDAYHTCYVLSGLSSAQHLWTLGPSSTSDDAAAPSWSVSPLYLDEDEATFNQEDRVRPIHPVYAIPQETASAMREYFLAKEGFF